MDPYLLSRIGDVTIQRVSPKQDAPKKEISLDQQTSMSSNPLGELDLSMKPQSSSSIDKADDKGGGESSLGGGKNFDYSDTSDEEDEEDFSDEDEQDVPLSLVTTKRSSTESLVTTKGNPADCLSHSLINSAGTDEPVTSPTSKSNDGTEENRTDTNKCVDSNDQLILNNVNDDGLDKDLSDNDDDLPLSRFIAEAVGDVESEVDYDKYTARREETDDYEGEEDGDAEGEEDEPEDEDEAENLVKGDDQEQDEGESGEEDPESEMIVVKQEVFDEMGDEDPNVKRKMGETSEDGEDNLAKKSRTESGNEDSESGSDSESKSQSGMDKTNAERKLLNLRKNIREVMDENQLDEATLAAQRQEMERLQRVQEQQRIIREVNRQINLNRQNTKTQTRVISLLQGGGTSLLKASPPGASSSPKSTSPNTVLVKLSSGSGPPQVVNKKVLEILRSTKSTSSSTASSKATALANKLLNNKPHSLTPSVSIAPVKPGLTITKMGKATDNADKTVRKILGKTKQKGKDVVTISSSSSDEDDCILISEPSGGEEEEEEEDPTNSGMHTNDLYNVPDDQGRVLINVGRPENEPDVFLAPQIARIIKPHQVGGVRFLYDNVVESLERFKTSPGFGCILAHSMGLGKTLQVVSFCDVFLRYTEGKTVLCIMPINTLQNWMAEFNMWLPVDPSMSPFSIQGEVQPRTFPLFVLNDLQKTMVARAKIVTQWAKEGGVLLIGYELYRQLSLRKPRKRRCNSKRKLNPEDDIDDEKNKNLLEEMHAALVKPGPDLIICDEGHRIKNSHASVSQALKQIRSKRRVVLTGYPLQNNLLEYWCMVDFVRPNYLGTKTEFSNMFERPIQNGQCIDSTPQDIRLMRYRAHVLHSLLEGFVQRRSHSVLTNALPQKEEYVILVRMTTFQRTLYDTFMNEVVRTKAVPNPLKAFAVCCKIWNHPDVLYHFLKRRNTGSEAVDLDLEETAGVMAPVPVPGGTVVPVMPVKRGRGRSPKGTSPIKRERKVNPRKRGVAESDSPAKSPVVAAVMPNTTSSIQHSDASPHSLPQQHQLDIKPPPPFPQPSGSTGNQFRPNFPSYPSVNNSFQSQYSGMNQNYPNYTAQPSEFQGMQPSYQNPHNQQGFNNQSMYSSFSGNYYSSQDPSFSGGNYWNNPFFNNEQSNSGMFPNYNDPDPNSSNFYNQEMIASDGFNSGPRGYNNGMNMNRPTMTGMNPLQQGRMGMNNPSHGMLGMNSSMGGMSVNNLNSMGMPINSMNSNNMSMNQNSYGMNSVSMNAIGQSNLGPQTSVGMNMNQGNLGLAYQGQGMGMNQMGGMNTQSHHLMNTPSNTGHMAMNMPVMNQMNPNSTDSISQSGMSSQNMSSGSMHTMTNSQVSLMSNTSNQSSMESQQQAAIESIANNLMMSSQQSMQSSHGLLGNAENHNNPNHPNNPPQSIQNTQQTMGTQNLMSPHHNSQDMHGNTTGMSNNPQSLMGATQSQMGNIPGNSQNQGNSGSSQNSPLTNQTNTIPISQNSHVMTNMSSNSQNSQNISSHSSQNMGSLQHIGASGLENQNLMMLNQQSHVLGNTLSSATSQNVGNIPSQQGYLGNQPLTPNIPGNVQNPMYRNQQPNQNMYGQQNSLPLMNNHQGMFGGNNLPMQNMINTSQNPHMNQHITNHNSMGSSNMSNIEQSGSQNMLGQQSHPGNQNMMDTSQNQNVMGSQDTGLTSGNSLQTNMGTKQNLGNLSGNQQDSQNNQPKQNLYSNQNVSNPMGNLQNMINNQNMLSSQSGIQNIMQAKSSGLGTTQDPNHQSLMDMHQNMPTSTQQNMSDNPSRMMINQQGGLNDQTGQNMHPNQPQQCGNSVSTNSFIDSQQNMFGMNSTQLNQPGFMNNQTMIGMGNQHNVMNNPNMMNGSQNMMMNNSTGQGAYGNNMTQHDMMSGPSGMMGNQMNNPSFNSNQMGCGNNMMGMYNQSGMMNYPGMMMGNQMNNFGMMNQQNMNNPHLQNQNQLYGNNMMRHPSSMMGMRNTQPTNPQGGINPSDMNQGVFNNNQNNFGAFSSGNAAPSSFNSNQTNQVSKEASGSFENNSNSRFLNPVEFQCGNNQSNSQHENLPHSNFGNDFNNFGLNNEDSKIWNEMSNKCGDEKSAKAIKPEEESNTKEESVVKKENNPPSQENKSEEIKSPSQNTNHKMEEENVSLEKKENEEVKKEEPPKEEGAEGESKEINTDITTAAAPIRGREDAGIPYDWATELLKGYMPGNIEASAKMALLFCILEEAMFLGDRVLVFSQSLFTLNLIEDFLQKTYLPGRQEKWARNWNYYRLDGSTSAMEREKLINEFNSNPNIHLFLVSTRAGSLGINLVGANRVVVLDASWNPCHDTQAVCRVYRYGQKKPCFVYRLVTDNCLEKKIYDRQINKQGMADRVVDECNPDAHLSIKEVTNLCWDNEEDSDTKDFADIKDKFIDVVMQKLLEKYSKFLSKEPFQHESLLVDRKDKKLSQAEKRLAKRSYELEKQASINNTRPVYGYYPGNTSGVGRGNPMMKPMASVRPMQSELNNQLIRDASSGRPRQWIPAEVWQKQGMSAQEMTLPLDVVIPTNSPDRSSIVLKAGQKVMVLKSPKGIYMQLENGKIIAIRTAFKVGGKGEKKGGAAKGGGAETGVKKMVVQPTRQRAPNSLLPLRNNSNISIIPRGGSSGPRGPNKPLMRLLGSNRGGNQKQPVAAAKPYFGEGSAHPPVTVTVTKKKIPSNNQQPSTSTAQLEICRESKQVTVTPIPPPSPKTTPQTETEQPRTSTESSNDSSSVPTTGESDQRTVEEQIDKVVCSVEIKPVKSVPSSVSMNESGNASTKIEETADSKEDKGLPEKLDEKLTLLPDCLAKGSHSKKISIEERAKMEPSLQPVVSLKNYRHHGSQNREKSKSSKVTINPLPFKTGSSLSISPVTSKSSVATVELPSSSSLSIQPVKLPASTSVNLVKPHSSFSVTPVSEIEKKSVDLKEPSMSITKIKEKPSTSSLTITPTSLPSAESTSKSDTSTSLVSSENQSITSTTSIFPVNENTKSSLTIQPSEPSGNTTAMSSFNSPMDFSFRPDFPQLSGTRPDFYAGFPRPPMGFSGGNFFPPRKDLSGKDVPQFPSFDAASFLSSNPFSAAAASSNFTGPSSNSPFTPTPRMGQPNPQPPFDTDFTRMYSAFHRPEPQQATTTGFPIPPTQYSPYPYSPFLMHPGFPISTTNSQSNPTPSNPSNLPTQ